MLDDCWALLQSIVLYSPASQNWLLAVPPHIQSSGSPEASCATLAESPLHLPALHLEKGLIPTAHVLDPLRILGSPFHPTLSRTGKQGWHLHFRMYTCKLHQSKDRLLKAMDQCSPAGGFRPPITSAATIPVLYRSHEGPPSLPTLGLYCSTGMELKPHFATISTESSVERGAAPCHTASTQIACSPQAQQAGNTAPSAGLCHAPSFAYPQLGRPARSW